MIFFIFFSILLAGVWCEVATSPALATNVFLFVALASKKL